MLNYLEPRLKKLNTLKRLVVTLLYGYFFNKFRKKLQKKKVFLSELRVKPFYLIQIYFICYLLV